MAKIKVFEPAPNPPTTPKTRKTHFSGKDKPSTSESLFSCSWRGLGFPIESMKFDMDQDLAEHKYWGIDSASVESTGRNPLRIEATIPFVNGIVPGKNERWSTPNGESVILFPNVFVFFLEAMNDRTSGVLDTPQFAGLTCKPVSAEWEYDANIRNGVRVTARWVETIDPDVASNVTIATINDVYLPALSLDAAAAGAPEVADPSGISFEQLVNEIGGIVDTTASRISLLLNKPAQLKHRLNALRDRLERAPNVMLWPVEQAAQDLKAALEPLAPSSTVVGTGPEALGPQRKPSRQIGRYKTFARTTLNSLLTKFSNNTIDDLIYLNPRLLARPSVPGNTVVRYYL